MKHDIGVLSAPTAFGKTTIAAYLIAERKVNTLVLVHRRLLMDQWHERLKLFLNTDSIGRIGGGRLHRLHDNKKIVRIYDYVDVHVPMFTRMFEKRLKGYKAIGYSVRDVREGSPDLLSRD